MMHKYSELIDDETELETLVRQATIEKLLEGGQQP